MRLGRQQIFASSSALGKLMVRNSPSSHALSNVKPSARDQNLAESNGGSPYERQAKNLVLKQMTFGRRLPSLQTSKENDAEVSKILIVRGVTKQVPSALMKNKSRAFELHSAQINQFSDP